MEGHGRLDLVIRKTAHGKFGSPVFRFHDCGAVWKRRYEGSGTFVWKECEEGE